MGHNQCTASYVTCASRSSAADECQPGGGLSPAEVHEHPPEVARIFLDPVVEGLDVLLVQEAQHPLLELPTAFARNDLHNAGFLRHCFLDDRSQGRVDLAAPVVDLVEVEFELHRRLRGAIPIHSSSSRRVGGKVPGRSFELAVTRAARSIESSESMLASARGSGERKVTPMKLRPTTYRAYSVSCALIWGAVLIVVGSVASTHIFLGVLLVFFGWALGWFSATIARAAYPQPPGRSRATEGSGHGAF
jgi:hypothetical protein